MHPHPLVRARNVCSLCMKAFCDTEHVFRTLIYFFGNCAAATIEKETTKHRSFTTSAPIVLLLW